MASIPHPAQALLGSSALAHVVTLNGDGTPQVSVVWCGVRGDEILFVSEAATRKVRNLRRDPRVLLSIEDEERNLRGLQQHLVVAGHASLADGADPALMDELCRVYLGRPDAPLDLRSSPTAVTVTVAIDRISGNGPWVSPT
jgi:PPOX class probable F420-dependent enzyme